MSTKDKAAEFKKIAAEAAVRYLEPGMIIGVGTGSTTNLFIDSLHLSKGRIEAAIASSHETEKRLKAIGIPVIELNSVSEVPVYVDGADEFNQHRYLIKGAGGALTREKVIATCAKKFICIVDASKEVGVLGNTPLPIEVIPMARSFVARALVKLGGSPVYRAGFVTDNGNVILDTHNLDMMNPIALEQTLNAIPGVVENGLFARRPADIILVGSEQGVRVIE